MFAGIVCRRFSRGNGSPTCPGKCFHSAGNELWVSDLENTFRVADINPGELNASPRHLASFQGVVFFQATTQTYGAELWMSNGTLSSTFQVMDIANGPKSSSPKHLTPSADDSTLYFQADDAIHGAELWVSDGVGAFLGIDVDREAFHRGEGARGSGEGSGGTHMVVDLWPGQGSSSPSELLPVLGKHILFVASSQEYGRELFTSDGTAEGTQLLLDVLPGDQSSDPAELTLHGNKTLYFVANDVHGQRDMHVIEFDCCPISVTRHQTVASDDGKGSSPKNLLLLQGSLLFTAMDRLGERHMRCLPAGHEKIVPCFEETKERIEVLGPMVAFKGAAYFAALRRNAGDVGLVVPTQTSTGILVDTGIEPVSLNISCTKCMLWMDGVDGGGMVSVTGSARDVNAALATLRYEAKLDEEGRDDIVFTLFAFLQGPRLQLLTEEKVNVWIRPQGDNQLSNAAEQAQ